MTGCQAALRFALHPRQFGGAERATPGMGPHGPGHSHGKDAMSWQERALAEAQMSAHKSNSTTIPPITAAGERGFHHVPVLLDAVLAAVPTGARLLVDATLGGGGHAEALLQNFPEAELFGCDRDPRAVEAAQERLAPFGPRAMLRQTPFAALGSHLLAQSVDFLLADLGVSSHQIDTPERGFQFSGDGPLRMTMDGSTGAGDAAHLLAEVDEPALTALLRDYGEERYARQIARAILAARAAGPITRTGQLANIISGAVPGKYRRGPIHPATRTFQALRIAVNDELGQLDALLDQALDLLRPGGRVAVISFHSLEDRRVKQCFARWENPCTCPAHMPACVCGRTPLGRRLGRKAQVASEAEVGANPRSRSARLRVFEKAGGPAEDTSIQGATA